ncbi:hypothetical protein [Natronosporangium hydrolyticum]|uniref:hypothetical protein n=1 Tax=Natronosporangium hydrolyticum TaxID=2811111 RepID=UPI001EFA1BC4|nr:hypothetical protein [Natronosporangium hydrolyticum]
MTTRSSVLYRDRLRAQSVDRGLLSPRQRLQQGLLTRDRGPEAVPNTANLVVDSARDTERVARYLSGGFVDGAVIVSARVHDPITRVVTDLGLPATFVGHPPDLANDIPFVGIDKVGSARAITERLLATGSTPGWWRRSRSTTTPPE